MEDSFSLNQQASIAQATANSATAQLARASAESDNLATQDGPNKDQAKINAAKTKVAVLQGKVIESSQEANTLKSAANRAEMKENNEETRKILDEQEKVIKDNEASQKKLKEQKEAEINKQKEEKPPKGLDKASSVQAKDVGLSFLDGAPTTDRGDTALISGRILNNKASIVSTAIGDKPTEETEKSKALAGTSSAST